MCSLPLHEFWAICVSFVTDDVLLERLVLVDWFQRLGTEAGFDFNNIPDLQTHSSLASKPAST